MLVRDPEAGGFAAMKVIMFTIPNTESNIHLHTHPNAPPTPQHQHHQVIDKMKLNRSRDRTRLRNELWALTQMTPSPFLLQLRSAFGK